MTAMRLYLVQHGDAVPKAVDAGRPLSGQGRRDVERIGALLRRNGIRVARIVHSGKTRARQTAAILGDALGGDPAIDAADGLGPNDPVGPWAGTVDGNREHTMLVGHMPFMGRLVSLLVAGDDAAEIVRFRPGTVVCLDKGSDSGWALAWMVGPELACD
jgi:phosphohistidine phosphatase